MTVRHANKEDCKRGGKNGEQLSAAPGEIILSDAGSQYSTHATEEARMENCTISPEFQVVIPKSIRERIRIAGDRRVGESGEWGEKVQRTRLADLTKEIP